MEDSKSNTNNEDDDDHFFDALDEFSYDTNEHDQSISNSSPIYQLESNADVLLKRKPSPEIVPPIGLRRRRSWSKHIRKEISGDDSENSNPNSSVSFDSTTPADKKYRISRKSKEIGSRNEKSDSFRASHSSNEENEESSAVTTENDDTVNESLAVDSASGGIDESSSNFLFVLAGFVIKAIGFQLSLLVSFFTFPIWLLYRSYMLVLDPLQVVRRSREYLMGRLWRIWGVMCENVTPFVYEWLKEHKSIWKLALRFGWGFLWATYVCLVLVSLLVSAFVVSGFIVRHVVEEPIQMKETLTFDYTKNSPVAFVRIISCPGEHRGIEYLGAPRFIPPKHKLQVTVSLTLPESDYNRNLGIFQARVDFLSASDKALASSSRPCMLRFKSQPIRLLLTFLKVAPLVTGYSSESQTLNVKFRGFTEGDKPTACLRVMIEQRAEFQPGAGVPEIYDASLTLESELPLLKRIIWHWKNTVFIWIGMTTFAMEFLFILLCCRPIIMPRGRVRDAPANNSALQNNNQAEM
ncbi:LOW QUALITY PROTEIN: seipin-2-like [Actinidia eriantha]|uniref:LOW QUALITY PROTEIN: seipin-2-like n=1 Tax=Actinidia eriantha TaxID=165200 RepID=UPI0025859385|nr:LOW QUALITY PROTEIN: seipin-2-like [Actinidia eriantha]